jgi:hypothetical protein
MCSIQQPQTIAASFVPINSRSCNGTAAFRFLCLLCMFLFCAESPNKVCRINFLF